MTLANGRKALAKIAIAAGAPEAAQYAAKELRYYLGRMTAAPFEIADATSSTATEPSICLSAPPPGDPDGLGNDGYRIDADAGSITIRGGRRGILYGAYALLERLGCRFFAIDCEKIPVSPSLELAPFLEVSRPTFEYREHNYWPIVSNPRLSAKLRLNGDYHKIPSELGGNIRYAMFVHSFSKLIPPEIYGKTHPEFFAVINGCRCNEERGLRTQLCLTCPGLLEEMIDRVRETLREHPEATIISLSQNDLNSGCECERCRRSDAETGSPGGTMLKFVNAVAAALKPEFPDVIFDTLAYQYTRPAPNGLSNLPNVCVRLCSIECCFSHPFESCSDSSRAVLRPDGTLSRFIDDLREWGRICDRVYVWDYTTCFAHYPSPHPNWHSLQPNMQAFAENNVKGVLEQACYASRGGVDFNELRAYLISKLLWNPWCNLDEHRREFMEHYYGAAAPALSRYLDMLCDKVERDDIHVGFNGNPVAPFLDESMLDLYDALFDEAEAAVRDDPVRHWRVMRNRLSIRWVRLKRAQMLHGHLDAVEVNRFFDDWRTFGMSRIDEWVNIETTFRALLEGRWRGVEFLNHWKDESPEYL